MSDTLGSLIDKLITIDMKMWDNQEMLYAIRRMSFEEFNNIYKDDLLNLFNCLKKCCDLNYQRNILIDEVDEKIVDMIKNKDFDKYIQRKHKTY